VIPFTHEVHPPLDDPALRFALDAPPYVVHYQRGHAPQSPLGPG
jgi:hypothetical protein